MSALPKLISITNPEAAPWVPMPVMNNSQPYVVPSQPVPQPFWGPISIGTSGGISEGDVSKAYMLGLQQGTPKGSPRPVELRVQGGIYNISAPAVPASYSNGQYRNYNVTIPWALPKYYPINITFTLAGNMCAHHHHQLCKFCGLALYESCTVCRSLLAVAHQPWKQLQQQHTEMQPAQTTSLRLMACRSMTDTNIRMLKLAMAAALTAGRQPADPRLMAILKSRYLVIQAVEGGQLLVRCCLTASKLHISIAS